MNNTTHHIIPGTPEHARLMTASKVAAALALSPHKMRAVLWHEMRGEGPSQEVTDAMKRGTIQEDSIIQWFFQIMHPDLEKRSGEVTVTRDDMPWAAANPDAVAITEGGRIVFVEAKSVARAKVANGKVEADEWGRPGTDEIPLYYYVQCMWQMHMTHGESGEHVTETRLIKHGPFVDQYDEYIITYDAATAQNIAHTVQEFYDSLTLNECPWPIEDKVGIHQFFANINPDVVPDSSWEIAEELAIEYIDAKDAKKQAQAHEDGVKARILKAMGTAKNVTCNGHKIAYRRSTKKGVSLYPPMNAPTVQDITTK